MSIPFRRHPDFEPEGRPAIGGEHRLLGYGRAACEIEYLREIRGRRVPVFASFNRPDCRGGAVKHGKTAMRLTFLATTLACASASNAQTSPDPSTFAELKQETVLPQITSAMRRTATRSGIGQ
jgi:hypothetical protein